MDAKLPPMDANWLKRFRAALRRWHARHGRDLPWRRCGDPYKVWISEVMLQQTTVAAVKPYFERFLRRFPDVQALAAAEEQDVLRLWEGLGYYSRARNLHRAANVVVAQHRGQFPRTVDELRQLPGVGRYTAGAIVSFGFDRPAPIVEANTLRLYSRLLGLRDDPRSAAGQQRLWNFAEQIVSTKQPGEFNQALTDLGALICTPKDPQCESCPVASGCRAFAEQAQAEIPRATQRATITDLREASVAIEFQGRFLLMRRADDGRWAGMWDFPRFTLDADESDRGMKLNSRQDAKSKAAFARDDLLRTRTTLEQQIASELGIRVRLTHRLVQLQHSVTRYRITLDCWQAECETTPRVRAEREFAWLAPRDLANVALPITARRFSKLLPTEGDSSRSSKAGSRSSPQRD